MNSNILIPDHSTLLASVSGAIVYWLAHRAHNPELLGSIPGSALHARASDLLVTHGASTNFCIVLYCSMLSFWGRQIGTSLDIYIRRTASGMNEVHDSTQFECHPLFDMKPVHLI